MRHLLIPVLLLGCSGLDRSNPYDPANGPGETTELTLSLPLGKVLASVIHRVEAVITSPTTPTILRQLDITPLGPATATIGTLQPGGGYTLTLRGYDIVDELIFEGQQNDIIIGNNDTTLVEFQLTLLVPLPDIDTGSSGQTDGDAPGETDTAADEEDAETDTAADEEDADAETGADEVDAEETD